jgi:hypothetical protein
LRAKARSFAGLVVSPRPFCRLGHVARIEQSMLNREVWTKQRRLPKILCYLKRRYLQIGPPGSFVDLSVQL